MYQSRPPSHINFKSMFKKHSSSDAERSNFFCRIHPLWNIILKTAIHIAVKRNIFYKSRQHKIHVSVVLIIFKY